MHGMDFAGSVAVPTFMVHLHSRPRHPAGRASPLVGLSLHYDPRKLVTVRVTLPLLRSSTHYVKFTDTNLKPGVLAALQDMGFDEMTPIQELAIPHILEGSDLLGLAETGSGKTSACGVPLVDGTDPEPRSIQHLILVPTRELALQYVQELDDVAKHSDVVCFAVFGGFDMSIQKSKLKHGVHILVATPGRLIDFIWNTKLDLTQVRTVVLDEADEMLKMGFIEDVDFILSCLLQEHQTLMFSATMPPEIDSLAKRFQKDPVRIELNREQQAPQSLQHHFLHSGRNRLQALKGYLDDDGVRQALIFCNSRDKASDLHQELRREFRSLEIIHGGLSQDKRTSLFHRFREQKIKYMIATDVAGRGLDFTHVTHVINFDFPLNPEIYTHRTGRTGRMGRTGIAMTIVTDRDLGGLKSLLKTKDIEPTWHGEEPDLATVGARRGGRGRGRPPQSKSSGGRRVEHHGPPKQRPHRGRRQK